MFHDYIWVSDGHPTAPLKGKGQFSQQSGSPCPRVRGVMGRAGTVDGDGAGVDEAGNVRWMDGQSI